MKPTTFIQFLYGDGEWEVLGSDGVMYVDGRRRYSGEDLRKICADKNHSLRKIRPPEIVGCELRRGTFSNSIIKRKYVLKDYKTGKPKIILNEDLEN